MTMNEPRPDSVPTVTFINRELSLLQFQRRVLAQAAAPEVPLLERLRFLCIVSSNLDEFFEVRVAGVKERIRLGIIEPDPEDGLTPAQLLAEISLSVHQIIDEQYRLLNEEILPALEKEGIAVLRRDRWSEALRDWVAEYFEHEVSPVLTPIGLDPAHPFPRVLNKSLNFAVELEGEDAFGRDTHAAIVQAPRALPRIIPVPAHISGIEHGFVFLSSVVHAHVGELFPGMSVLGCYQFRVTRNSDLFVDEEEVTDLRSALKGELQQRHYGDSVRLEVADNCSRTMTRFLLHQFNLAEDDLYRTPGIVNLVRLMQLPDRIERPDLTFTPYKPGLPRVLEDSKQDLFSVIRSQDVLLHHPYERFVPVINLLRAAADDPAVLAVKMTVYRTGSESILMEHLMRAAQKGKEVTVVLELMARFDEEANINWASRLEEVGVHVVYGVFGFKTHAKLLMLVRRDEDGLRRYVHLGTGNYHPRTTAFYTDFGLLTCNAAIGDDVAELFKQITGVGRATRLTHLWQAPFALHANVVAHIRAEAQIAREGRKAKIIAKMNALLESEVIEALYDASRAGVEVDLIVRGPCALRPGVDGLSENIRVRSVVGRFLEHHRIFFFHADGEEKMYLSSADWMDRNFFRRIEVAFPVLDPKLKRRVMKEGLRAYLTDNCMAWEMLPDGQYRRKVPRGPRRSAQQMLMDELTGQAKR
jgi:polyphosphate kinase